jgi:hypothetical protein
VILFALQLCPIDAREAIDLAQLVCAIEPIPTQTREWLVCYRQDTPVDRVMNIQRMLGAKFSKVHIHRAEHFATGWPQGSNALWLSTMEYAAELYAHGITKAEGVLTFEPDCCPVRRDWMTVLEMAYSRRQRPVVGHLHRSEIPDHINGNLIVPITLLADYPKFLETPPTVAWDFFNRELLLSIGEDTPFITQLYQKKQLQLPEWRALSKHGFRPALLHGVKDASARTLARAELASPAGSKLPLAPPRKLVLQP